MNRVVDKIVYQCMGYRKGERILIITDDQLIQIANFFYERIKILGIETLCMRIIPRRVHGEEPPPEVASALKTTHIALLITSKSLSHTLARQIASRKHGVRIASMPGITLDILRRSLDIDYEKLYTETKRLAKILNKGRNVRVTTERGTDVSFSIKGRKIFEDNGIYTQRGAFGNLPAGEICLSPLEGTTQGKLIVDASFAGWGKLEEPLKFEIKDGFVKKINNLKLKKFLSAMGKSAYNIAEFGIGLNPKAKITGNVLEDEKAKNTAHFALGDNLSFGGRIRARCHLDGVFRKPQIWVDGVKLVI